MLRHADAGFTLIELLVVIAIIAVLAVVVVLTLNPAGLLQESRDTNRLSDMATLNSAINLSLADNASEFLGLASTTYVSVPDPVATSTAGDQCQGLGLPALPATFSWHCAASSTFRKTDGTGWVPVNLGQLSFGTPLAQLPADPINTSSSNLLYTYQTNGARYELTTLMESQKYQMGGSADKVSSDGGFNPVAYEVGTSPALSAFARNLWSNVGDFEGGDNGFSSYSGGTFGWTNVYGSVAGANAEFVTANATFVGSNYGGILNSLFPTSTTLTVGRKYIIIFYAKSIANPGVISVSNQNGSGDNSCFAFNFTPTTQWQVYSKTCTLDFNKNQFYFWSQVPSQQFVIDDLQIESVP